MIVAIIERPDGTTYEQQTDDLDKLNEIIGKDYWIIDWYEL